MSNDFYDEQSDLTALKILVYQQYIQNYLPKVLMQFGKCFIADFFCGPGMNGTESGSPIVLLEAAKKMLEDETLRNKWPNPEVIIVFSDASKVHIDDLTRSLEQFASPSGIKIIGPFCEEFSSILRKTIEGFRGIREPKFFFLDPFKYNLITIDEVKELIDTPASEVLLFLPTFHAYRFVSCADDTEVLKNFLENYTDRGCVDYESINDFNESIRRRLLAYLNLKYVRTIRLDDGTKKNAMFYLTKHVAGMIEINKIAWKHATNGMTVKVKKDSEQMLFDPQIISRNFESVKNIIREYIKEKKVLTNVKMIEKVAIEGFTNKYANELLKEMQTQGLIEVEYKKRDKTRGFYIADSNWNKELAIIKYKER
jgi:three-Cys-motif partner protein